MPTAISSRSSYLQTSAQVFTSKILLGLAATLVVAAAAHIAVPLPFTPVPLTLQPLAVLCVGLAFGPTGGFLIMLVYLAEGAAGLPVFSPTGPGGLLQLFGATGGFLLSYPLVAAIAGGLTRLLDRSLPRFASALVGCSIAVVALFLCGAGWLGHLTHASASSLWVAAVLPFLPGEAIKIAAAAGLYRTFARSARS